MRHREREPETDRQTDRERERERESTAGNDGGPARRWRRVAGGEVPDLGLRVWDLGSEVEG